MPELCRFFGIIITMYSEKNAVHNKPHFHARYNEFEASIDIEDYTVSGHLPPKVLGMVIEWAAIHKEELLEDWHLLYNHNKPKKIKPLE
jgi:hypothetical protein